MHLILNNIKIDFNYIEKSESPFPKKIKFQPSAPLSNALCAKPGSSPSFPDSVWERNCQRDSSRSVRQNSKILPLNYLEENHAKSSPPKSLLFRPLQSFVRNFFKIFQTSFTSEKRRFISSPQKNLQKKVRKVLIPSAVPICSSSTPKRGRWCRLRLQFGSVADLSDAGMDEIVSGIIRRSGFFRLKTKKTGSGWSVVE